MKIRLKTMWQGIPAGRELDLGKGQATLLIQRNIAEEIEATPEPGGVMGSVKAFLSPNTTPAPKKKGR